MLISKLKAQLFIFNQTNNISFEHDFTYTIYDLMNYPYQIAKIFLRKSPLYKNISIVPHALCRITLQENNLPSQTLFEGTIHEVWESDHYIVIAAFHKPLNEYVYHEHFLNVNLKEAFQNIPQIVVQCTTPRLKQIIFCGTLDDSLNRILNNLEQLLHKPFYYSLYNNHSQILIRNTCQLPNPQSWTLTDFVIQNHHSLIIKITPNLHVGDIVIFDSHTQVVLSSQISNQKQILKLGDLSHIE